MNVQHGDAKSICLIAVDIASAEERRAFLDAQCAGDNALRAKVEALLAHHEGLGSFLRDAPTALTSAFAEPLSCGSAEGSVPAEGPGTFVGPYELLEQIAEGGMGRVFMAEQQHPLRRKVALKIIKPGMDSRQVITRFEAERQALAVMDHPNIAKVLDGGLTETSRPFFVMEYVKGVPITEYCDATRLSVPERLNLFVQVCSAVQYAHQKGIIHRDLKPSNILVASYDDRPMPKVIDFGLAKALHQPLTERTMFTAFGTLIGTLEYMAPEQAELNALDVDTRNDIYSLGVILYELLTGTTLFDKERLRVLGYDEMQRIIREEEPLRPSARLSTLGQVGATVSAQRKSDPKRLSQLFRGELDRIVMKALEKDRSRRYQTASAFAADVQRYLNDEPVEACPPSLWYRFRKFTRWHRAGLRKVAAGPLTPTPARPIGRILTRLFSFIRGMASVLEIAPQTSYMPTGSRFEGIQQDWKKVVGDFERTCVQGEK